MFNEDRLCGSALSSPYWDGNPGAAAQVAAAAEPRLINVSFSWARNTLEDGRLHGYAPAPGFVSVADRHLAGAVVRPEETAAGSSPHRPAGSRARLLRRKGADRFPVACVEGAA
jgi:hypothetical protein